MSLEIERKWLLKRLPDAEPMYEGSCYQSYLSVDPTVRIRQRGLIPEEWGDATGPCYRVTIKGKGTMSREEVEIPITLEQYQALRRIIGDKPPIEKHEYFYSLEGYCDTSILADLGEQLRCDVVDPGTPDSFICAEVEFKSVDDARVFEFPFPECEAVDVTDDPVYKINEYWKRTRL